MTVGSDIEEDIALVGHLEAVPTILQVLCDITGLRFAAVARVTDGAWTACAVLDQIDFGLVPGSTLDVDTTLCKEVRASGLPIVIGHASEDPIYSGHMTPKLFGIESYVSVPIVLPGGEYFGNLCAIDPKPTELSNPTFLSMFVQFAALIARQLHNERKSRIVQSALLEERAARDLRDQLMSIMSRDLRVPIGSIALNCRRLKSHADEPAIVEAIASELAKDAKHAADILVNAPGAESGPSNDGIVVQPVLVARIDEALFGVVAEVQSSHRGREIEWQFDITRPVRVDRGRIQQLAANLLRNALRLGAPFGKARMTASTSADEFMLSVWNDGDCISAERLADAFTPTWDAASVGHQEGLEAGLYLSSKIVKAHGGRLSFSSDRQTGTTLAAVFPA